MVDGWLGHKNEKNILLVRHNERAENRAVQLLVCVTCGSIGSEEEKEEEVRQVCLLQLMVE